MKYDTLKIIGHYASLAAAVEAVKPDLSYNEEEAARRIRDLDRHCTQAVATEGGAIYYVYSADIELLHKFEPFFSCLDNGNLRVAFVIGDTLSISEPRIPKTKEGRNWFKEQNALGHAVKYLAA